MGMSSLILVAVVVAILWRPWNINESIPAFIGALLVIVLGFVSWNDLKMVSSNVSGAAITIASTIIMSSVLDKVGFFTWASTQLAKRARGNGKTLFLLTLLLSFLMTMFFNNDGSILITTPIILEITRRLKFSKSESLPYLIGGALIASASSAPIGVSNLANLIALHIVGLNLNAYAALMFIPSMVGILVCGALLYLLFRKAIPTQYNVYLLDNNLRSNHHFEASEDGRVHLERIALHEQTSAHEEQKIDGPLFTFGVAVVVVVRFGFFVGAYFGVPTSIIAVCGALCLLLFYGLRKPGGVINILQKSPWHIIVFAFSMYAVVIGFYKSGATSLIKEFIRVGAAHGLFPSLLITGVLLTIMSCLMNNLPSIMIGTIVLTSAGLAPHVLQLSYLSTVLGSDIGSLLLPMGTLASLLWFHIVRQHIKITWVDYVKVSFIVIPPSLLLSIATLYIWGHAIL